MDNLLSLHLISVLLSGRKSSLRTQFLEKLEVKGNLLKSWMSEGDHANVPGGEGNNQTLVQNGRVKGLQSVSYPGVLLM